MVVLLAATKPIIVVKSMEISFMKNYVFTPRKFPFYCLYVEFYL
jgi:hypothetical protein